MMSVSSWTIIIISLACFTAVFMVITFYVLAKATRRYKEGTGSPFKLVYKKRKSSARNDNLSKAFSSGRARSLKSLHAYESDLAVEAERESRRVFEKSSAFEYWWDDSNIFSGRFHTTPMFYQGGRKGLEKIETSRKELNKMPVVHEIAEKNAASWNSDTMSPGCDAARIEDEKKGDFKL